MEEVLMGQGLATGMFYHAPAGTKLPDSPFATLPEAWKKVGDVTQDGITLTTDKKTEDLKNWANKIKRTVLTDHVESIGTPIMDTTEETMKTVFGADNVTVTDATADHGKLINVNLSAEALPAPEAYLFLMKDGETGMMIGCEKGQISELSDVKFAPGEGITWETTIKGLDDGWHYVIDDGAKTVTG